MKKHLNTLFVTLEGAYLKKDGEAIAVRHEGETKLRIPLHNLDSICCFGWDISASAQLMHACAEADISLSFHNPYGKFLASSQGPQSGNILLRREQYRRADCETQSTALASHFIAAKLANTRTVLLRAIRDHGDTYDKPTASALLRVSDQIAQRIPLLARANNLESIRGIEGESAALYFSVFQHLINRSEFIFQHRSKRPPLDPVNALLPFSYTLLAHDCRSACESVGLDPQCGLLHRDRSGRPSLALDLMEELRPFFADRFTLTLINRQQITLKDFDFKENGAVLLKDDSRKKVLIAWQERKQNEIQHPFLQEKITIGLLPQIQARLLARTLRGDHDAYPAFIWK